MALAAVYLPLILAGGALMSEPLFAALLLGALVAAVQFRRSVHRWRWALLAGVLGGLAILTRANAAILLLPLALAVWDARPRWSWRALAPPAVLVAVAALTVAPWTVRNVVELHAFVPVSTQLGTALAGTYNDEARADTRTPASWRSLRRVPELQYLVRTSAWRRTPEATLEKRLRAVSLDFIADHPGYVPRVVFWNTARALDLAGLTWSRHTYSTVSVTPGWADAGVVVFWLFALLAIAGALTRRARGIPLHVAAVPVLLWLSVVFLGVRDAALPHGDRPVRRAARRARARRGVGRRQERLKRRDLRVGLAPGPPRRTRDPCPVDPVEVPARDLRDLPQEDVLERRRREPEAEQALVVDEQLVLRRLLARVVDEVDLRAGEAGHELRQVDDAVHLGGLVVDPHPLAALGRVGDRQLDTSHGVADVDERARLAARPVDRQRVADRGLHEEPVQHGAVVAVVVEAVDEPLVLDVSSVCVPHTIPWCRSVIRRSSFLA